MSESKINMYCRTQIESLKNRNLDDIPDLEEVKDYLLEGYLEDLRMVYNYAVSEPEITRLAVLGFGEDHIEVAVYLRDPTEENCEKIGCTIFAMGPFPNIIGDPALVCNGEYYGRGLVIYEEAR